MPEFVVRMVRLLTVDYAVEAADKADAKARYLKDGEEVASRIEKQVVLKTLTPDEREQEGALS